MNQAQLNLLRVDFDEFWDRYPLKVGKLAAEKEYMKARRLASREKLLDGVTRYRETKPDDWPWCHPKTWLSQGRWLDEVKAPARKVAGSLQNWWDE